MLISQKKLDFYAQNNLNVLFEGERGVGKTSMIYQTFNSQGLKIKYFSAPTMDPWTDLVGVPTTHTRQDGKEVLKMVPPEDFADDKYDAIFIDELNRAQPKVLDALMELIQFKTINGKPYKIKMIWAAINPHSEDNNDYNVEKLDLALRDRFHIQVKVPYKVDKDFFKKELGSMGEIFCNWWIEQPEKVQKEISPRRLFQSAQFYQIGGDIKDMLYDGNIEKLKTDLESVKDLNSLKEAFNKSNLDLAKNLLNKNINKNVSEFILNNKERFDFFLPAINKEWVAKEFNKNEKVFKYLTAKNVKQEGLDIVKSILEIASSDFIEKNFDKLENVKNLISKATLEKIDRKNIEIKEKIEKQKESMKNVENISLLSEGVVDKAINLYKLGLNEIYNTSFSNMNQKISSYVSEIQLTKLPPLDNIQREEVFNKITIEVAILTQIIKKRPTNGVQKKLIEKLDANTDGIYQKKLKHYGFNNKEIKLQVEEYEKKINHLNEEMLCELVKKIYSKPKKIKPKM